MPCTNHPDVEATKRCSGCAEPYCDNCLVEVMGALYCGDCKVMAVDLTKVKLDEEDVGTQMTCPQSREALTLAIVGMCTFFCCLGIILEPIAIFKAVEAKRAIAAAPGLGGEGMANAALTLGITGLLLNAMYLLLSIIGAAAGG